MEAAAEETGHALAGSLDSTRAFQLGGGDLRLLCVFCPCAARQRAEGGDRHHQPEAADPLGLFAAATLEVPSETLEHAKTEFDPHAQRIPGGTNPLGRQVRQQKPGLLLALCPHADERSG